MLKDTEQADMDECVADTPGEKNKPLLVCRLCHCEFTNFKEHVKSLVHLDARETQLGSKQPIKHKNDSAGNGVSAKKPKIDDDDDIIIISESVEAEPNQENNDKSVTEVGVDAAEKDSSTSTDAIVEQNDTSSTKALVGEVTPAVEERNEGNVKTTAAAVEKEIKGNEKTTAAAVEKEIKGKEKTTAAAVKKGIKGNEKTTAAAVDKGNKGNGKTAAAASEKELTRQQKEFLSKHWCCSLCVHVHRTEDESFEEHAMQNTHEAAYSARLAAMKRDWAWRKSRKWIYVCNGCQFHTNDKAQFLTHVGDDKHEERVKSVLENAAKIKKTVPDKAKTEPAQKPAQTAAQKSTDTIASSQTNQTGKASAPSGTAAPNQKKQTPKKQNTATFKPGFQDNKNSIKFNQTNDAGKKPSQGPAKMAANKYQRGRKISPGGLHVASKRILNKTTARNLKQNNQQKRPPQNFAPNALSRNFSPNQGRGLNVPLHNQPLLPKPSVLGEYRPSFRDDFNRGDRPVSHPGLGTGPSFPPRPSGGGYSDLSHGFGADTLGYSEQRRDPLLSNNSPGYGPDPRSSYDSERYDQRFSRSTPLLDTPPAKFHPDPPFRGANQDLPGRQFGRLDFSPPRPAILPPNTSLDLASNSYLRLRDSSLSSSSPFDRRYGPDRGPSYNQDDFRSHRTSIPFSRR